LKQRLHPLSDWELVQSHLLLLLLLLLPLSSQQPRELQMRNCLRLPFLLTLTTRLLLLIDAEKAKP
jgi:hypothetical protein